MTTTPPDEPAPPRRSKPVSRARLVRRMFALLDQSVSEMEAQAQPASQSSAKAKRRPPAAKTQRDVLLLNRMTTTLARLVDLDTTRRAKKRPRASRQMIDIRDKLVQRIAELKRD